MTDTECAYETSRLFAAFPTHRLRDPAAAQVVYVQRLVRFEHADLSATVDALLDTEHDLPPISDVVAMIRARLRERGEREGPAHLARLEAEHQAQRNANGESR